MPFAFELYGISKASKNNKAMDQLVKALKTYRELIIRKEIVLDAMDENIHIDYETQWQICQYLSFLYERINAIEKKAFMDALWQNAEELNGET